MKREDKLFIKDMLDSIIHIEKFTVNMNFEQFAKDDKTNSAVIRKLEIIGEAAKNISKEIKQQYKDLPWSDIVKMRDKIIHSYFGVDYEIVWKTVKERLPEIKPKIGNILRELDK